jgi:uncharacterized protein YkwD
MIALLAAGAALWMLVVLVFLGICRASARADECEARNRIMEAGRRGVGVGLAAAAVSLAGQSSQAEAGPRQEPCANRDVPYEAAPALVREALVCEIDRARARRRDARRLRPDAQLDLAAGRHATDMVERRYFSHTSPGGGDLADRARRAGYAKRTCSWRVGEILAWGVAERSTASGTVAAWLDSTPHRRILVSRRYAELGVGTVAGTPYERYPSGVTIAVMLGRRRCST